MTVPNPAGTRHRCQLPEIHARARTSAALACLGRLDVGCDARRSSAPRLLRGSPRRRSPPAQLRRPGRARFQHCRGGRVLDSRKKINNNPSFSRRRAGRVRRGDRVRAGRMTRRRPRAGPGRTVLTPSFVSAPGEPQALFSRGIYRHAWARSVTPVSAVDPAGAKRTHTPVISMAGSLGGRRVWPECCSRASAP